MGISLACSIITFIFFTGIHSMEDHPEIARKSLKCSKELLLYQENTGLCLDYFSGSDKPESSHGSALNESVNSIPSC